MDKLNKKNKNNKKDWRYLGPSSFPQKLLRLLPFSIRFNRAAKVHDELYAKGGSLKDKKYADCLFAKLMLEDCKTNPFAYILAFVYFVSVRIFGVLFFNWK